MSRVTILNRIAPLFPLAAGNALLHSNVFVGHNGPNSPSEFRAHQSAQISGWGHVNHETADQWHIRWVPVRVGPWPYITSSSNINTVAEPLTIDAYVKSKSTPVLLLLLRFGTHDRSFRAACLTRSVLKAAASVRTRVKDADGDFPSPQ